MSKWLEEYLLYSRKSRSDNPNESVEEVLAKHERDLQEHAVKLFGKPIPGRKHIQRGCVGRNHTGSSGSTKAFGFDRGPKD